jgi:predicted metal-binding membrane protein
MALAFAASALVTCLWCGSMSGMPGMEMPGGWTMSMAWMRMPGQGWLDYLGLFLGMWVVMMFAMMLPAFAPMLARYRREVRVERRGMLSLCVSAGYFAVWTLTGLLLCPLGLSFAEIAMRLPWVSEGVPVVAALVVLAAGVLQFTAWKARQLACCRQGVECRNPAPNCRTAWRHGLTLGLRCVYCCAGLTAVLLVIGVMDLRAMALVTMAISAERLMPASLRAARVIGMTLLIMGGVMLFKATLLA